MTCIVALRTPKGVMMGADSAGAANSLLRVRSDPKIYTVGPFMFGFTSSFRMGQLLGHAFVPPDRDPRVPIEKFMATTFIDAVRSCLKVGGFAGKTNEVENSGDFLVAYAGRIFWVASDYQVGESVADFESVGCGSDLAMGALFATRALPPQERLETALSAAAAFSGWVRGPFIYRLQEFVPMS